MCAPWKAYSQPWMSCSCDSTLQRRPRVLLSGLASPPYPVRTEASLLNLDARHTSSGGRSGGQTGLESKVIAQDKRSQSPDTLKVVCHSCTGDMLFDNMTDSFVCISSKVPVKWHQHSQKSRQRHMCWFMLPAVQGSEECTKNHARS